MDSERAEVTFLISTKDGCHSVPEPVYVYICQLEAYIMNPKESKLMDVYGDRFKPRPKHRILSEPNGLKIEVVEHDE